MGSYNLEEDNGDISRNVLPPPGQPSTSALGKDMNNATVVNIVMPEAICIKRNIVKRKKSEGHENETEALIFLRTAAASTAEKDECTIFGQMVGTELRKLNPRNKVVPKNQI